MYNDQVHFPEFVKHRSLKQLRKWLLEGFATSSFDPIPLAIEPSAAIQLQRLAKALPIRQQERFKTAVVEAVNEWDLLAHNRDTLVQLARLAAYIRASDIIEKLREILKSDELECLKRSFLKDGTDAYKDTVQYLVAVIQGFAPHNKVKIAFEQLFFSDRFDARFAAQLFLGLCKCEPDEYTKYISRFMQLVRDQPSNYSLINVAREFVRIVTLPTIAGNFEKLNPTHGKQLLSWLCLFDGSPASLVRLEYTFALTSRVPKNSLETFPISVDEEISWGVIDQQISHIGATSYIEEELKSMVVGL